jgi:hypothetical protein
VVWTSSPREQERSPRPLRLYVTCPRTREETYIQIAPAEASGIGLTVLSCDRFPDGNLSCDQDCVRSAEHAAA